MLVTIYQADRYQRRIYILETIHRYVYIYVMNIKLCRRKVAGIVRNRPQIFSKLRSFARILRV